VFQQLLQIEYKNLEKAPEYEKLHGLTRDKFLKIFNLFLVLSHITVFKRIHKGYDEPLGVTPGCDYTKLPEIK
jgi:hypothetical protein